MDNFNINISEAFVEFWKRSGKSSLMKTSGNSMHPIIKEGSIITVSHLPPQDVIIGDIGVFKFKDKLCVHRIVGRENINGDSCFLEKGDNSLTANRISMDKFMGKVVSIKTGEKFIDLENPCWKAISFTVGIYWFLMCSFYKNAVAIKNLLNIKSNFLTTSLSRLFFLFSRLIPKCLTMLGKLIR